MNFSELYQNNREAVTRALTAMLLGESNERDANMVNQMKGLIGNLFADDKAMPVVQCMNSYKSVFSVPEEEAKKLVGSLWSAPYAPYEHQYQAWKTLLQEKNAEGKPMSVVVTTGTGSGKTECFMMPLVRDLIDNPEKGVQALFLYPLNALMEDQKARLEKLLDGTELHYAVFNSDLPEDEPQKDENNEDEDNEEAEKIRKRIDQIRGITRNGNGEITNIQFKRVLYTRKQVRETPPAILLTNPTMLEYILIRPTDKNITNSATKSLRWVSIDETHTYTGAGAAELAMLLRRVYLAFHVNPEDLRFATSSATFSNKGKEESEDAQDNELKNFIASITGTSRSQIRVVGGERVGEENINAISNAEDQALWRTIFEEEFVSLDELYPQGTIEEKLQQFDDLCSRVPEAKLKAKVHYFYRVPNNGLFVRLTEHKDGAFRIYTENEINTNNEKAPLLELMRCKHCGGYVAVAEMHTKGTTSTYEPIELDDSDMFDLPEHSSDDDDDDDSNITNVIFGLKNETASRASDNTGNVDYTVEGNHLKKDSTEKTGHKKENETKNEWHVVGNLHKKCPYCNTKLTRNDVDDEDGENTFTPQCLDRFRLSSEFLSRLIAPSILDQTSPFLVEDEQTGEMRLDPDLLHKGQQYISFVDSRQTAAQQTLNMNLEEERKWLYSIIYHELCRKVSKIEENKKALNELQMKFFSSDITEEEKSEIMKESTILNIATKPYLTWDEITKLVSNHPLCDTFCNLFAKQTENSNETDSSGNALKRTKEKYVQAIMVEYLAHRPQTDASPENMGLFHSCYPALEKIKELPDAVAKFNKKIEKEKDKINIEDWRNLLQIYMDYTVRGNEIFFLKLNDSTIDIMSTTRFSAQKPRRRVAKCPNTENGQHRVVLMLNKLNERNGGKATYEEVDNVVSALWSDLTTGKELLEKGVTYNFEKRDWVEDKKDPDTPWRYNLHNLCFSLYNDVYLVDTNTDNGEEMHTQRLRPIENHFKDFSPYKKKEVIVIENEKKEVIENKKKTVATSLDESLHEKWEPYPYFEGSGKSASKEQLDEWAKTHRSLLWNHHLWGTDGLFENRLEEIHTMPELFIQGEHTAQVDKMVSRKRQNDFKAHKVNILACSTTMEMGVDLGDLEVVVLASVPKQPSNYKQRSGRAGRNNKVRSACITLCGSDAIGLRTLYDPIKHIIKRPVKVPTVDLKSPQVVQRHVNAYLVRTFGLFNCAKAKDKSLRVVDFYTPFEIKNKMKEKKVYKDKLHEAFPDDKIGDPKGTLFDQFSEKCENYKKHIPQKMEEEMKQLLKETIFEGQLEYVINYALKENNRCYSELNMKAENLAEGFKASDKNEKFNKKVKMQYLELLNETLLSYWANNRFTPNANMPVNVMPFDLNSFGKTNSRVRPSNPNYTLRTALSQYAPGNTVTIDCVVYRARGVMFRDIYKGTKTFDTIYRNKENTVIGTSNNLSDKIPWGVNNKEGLELIRPIGFIPDINEESNRVSNGKLFTRVSAQLIDAQPWENNVTEPHLFSVRCNRDTGNSKILYYNEGTGHGFCFCTRCGKAVLETSVIDEHDNSTKIPDEMNDRMNDDTSKPRYHFKISSYKEKCKVGKKDIKRNVIIGDVIQTDYCEIRIRHKGATHWITNRHEEEELLSTLALVFTQTLVEILGKERDDFDFAITPNGHICIFDTNPGGAGYSNQLANMQLMKDVVKGAQNMLQEAHDNNSADMLVDKMTIRYLKKINVLSALSWIKEEEESCLILPDKINETFPNATEITFNQLDEAFALSFKESFIFANNDYKNWYFSIPKETENVDDMKIGWERKYSDHFKNRGAQTTFFILSDTADLPTEHKSVENSIKEWAKDFRFAKNPYVAQSLYPLAYINDTLYFTNNVECASLNTYWATGAIYCVRCGKFWE